MFRHRQQDIFKYNGKSIRIEKYENDSDVSIWVTDQGQMPAYGRLDIGLKGLKELSEILPEFIKELEQKR